MAPRTDILNEIVDQTDRNAKEIIDEDAIEKQEKSTRSALFSINRIDLLNPILPMVFGTWNNRPINPKALRDLKEAFRQQGILAYELDNALPLILHRSHLHPDALNMTIGDAEHAPMLNLTKEGMGVGSLFFAGGHHRYKVINELWKAGEKSLTKLEAKLEKKKGKLSDKLAKGKLKEGAVTPLQEEVEGLTNEIAQKRTSTLWAVKVYDADIVLKQGALGAQYLSRNMVVTRHAEDDAQKTLRMYKEYATITMSKDDSKSLKRWLDKMSKGDQNMVQVFQCDEDLRYLSTLYSFGNIFHNTELFSVKWIRSHLHRNAGGIIVRMLELIAGLTHGLFSKVENFEMVGDKEFDSYVELSDGKTKSDLEKAGHIAMRTWKMLMKAPLESRATDMLYVRNLGGEYDNQTLMDLVDAAVNLSSSKDKAFTDTHAWRGCVDEYYSQVETLIAQHIHENIYESKLVKDVVDGISGRLRWIRYDHSTNFKCHPIPLFSYSVVDLLIGCLEQVGPAIAEMLSWVYPYIWYSIQKPSADAPKDISSAFLRMVKENLDDEWKDPSKLIDEVVYLIVRSIDQLIVLNLDLEDMKIPARPDKLGQKLDVTKWGVDDEKVKDTINDMKEKKKTPGKMKNWVLRKKLSAISESQSMNRDYFTIAQAAVIESKIVNGYRMKLFKLSNSAVWLRQQLGNLANQGSKKKSKEYSFADGMKTQAIQDKPIIDIDEVVESRQLDRQYNIETKEMVGYLKRIEQSVTSHATPWSKQIHPEVSNVLKQCHDVILKNCQRRDLMRRKGSQHVDLSSSDWEINDDELDQTSYIPAAIYTGNKRPEGHATSEEDESEESDNQSQKKMGSQNAPQPQWRLRYLQDSEAADKVESDDPHRSSGVPPANCSLDTPPAHGPSVIDEQRHKSQSQAVAATEVESSQNLQISQNTSIEHHSMQDTEDILTYDVDHEALSTGGFNRLNTSSSRSSEPFLTSSYSLPPNTSLDHQPFDDNHDDDDTHSLLLNQGSANPRKRVTPDGGRSPEQRSSRQRSMKLTSKFDSKVARSARIPKHGA